MNSGIENPKRHSLTRVTKGFSVLPDNIFIVSTIGQIENAKRVIKQLGIKRPIFVYLFTKQNITLAGRLESSLIASGFQFEKIELPAFPALRLPHQVKAISRAYSALAREHQGAHLWISNINSHYGYLGHVFTQQGSSVNYFEEGLSTYLQACDPRLQPKPKRTISATIHSMKAALFSRKGSRKRRILNCAKQLVIYLFDTRPFYALSYFVTAGNIQFFYKNWVKFDRVAVTYPGVIDKGLYQARKMIELSPGTLTQITEAAAFTSDVQNALLKPSKAVLINQYYGIDPGQWAKLIADILIERGYFEVFVKFHPREKPKNRETLIAKMKRYGLNISECEEIDQYPIENVIKLFKANDVIGLTSTALLRIGTECQNVRVQSMSFPLIESLRQKNLMSAEAFEILKLDSERLEAMSHASKAGVEFWR